MALQRRVKHWLETLAPETSGHPDDAFREVRMLLDSGVILHWISRRSPL
jgi:hypothetical protein